MTQKIAAASTKRTESSVPTVAPSSYASLPKIAMAPKQAAEAMHMAVPEERTAPSCHGDRFSIHSDFWR